MALPSTLEAIVRGLHILSAVVWLGLLYFMAFIVPRMMAGLHEDSRRQLMPHLAARVAPWIIAGATGTILFGAILYWSFGDTVGFENVPMGLNVGVMLALVMYVLGMAFSVPVSLKAARVLQGGTPPRPDEMRRAMTIGRVNAVLSFFVLFFMVSSQRISALS